MPDYVEVLDLPKTSEINVWSFAFGKTSKQSGYAGLLALQHSWIISSQEPAGSGNNAPKERLRWQARNPAMPDYVEVLDLSKTSEVNVWSFAFGETP